ncbi:MAG TPA: sigma-54 dependent transcriptional regulator [Planctomycetota bacterium]|nr:sigma-54 dependent transcriptional regulator [Planctomycetota bacterium]
MSQRILVVEDEIVLNRSLVQRLVREGYAAEGARSAAEARKALESEGWDLVLLDMRLPDSHGLGLLREIREKNPDQLMMMMTAYSSIEDAVEAIKLGAADYVKKPFEAEELLLRIRRAFETTALRHEVKVARERSRERSALASVVGETPRMRELHEMVRRVAASEASTVLITGESGSGKDLIAKAIHYESRRSDKPFMTITCTAIAEQLLESELFGHEKGAFTNAVVQKKGLLELADGGTVFLDEIGDLSLSLQAKLLRFLQEKTFKRVGGTRDIKVDVRIIAATHQPLPTRVDEGKFRQDLYYRLKVVDVLVPCLRERAADIPLLARFFVADLNKELRRNVEQIAPDAVAKMSRYPWPGNVRELKNAIERSMILGSGNTIRAEDLPIEVRKIELTPEELAALPPTPPPAPEPKPVAAAAAAAPATPHAGAPAALARNVYELPHDGVDLDRLEKELIVQAMAQAKGNKTRAGRLLGLNRDQVRYRLEKYGLLESAEGRVEGE